MIKSLFLVLFILCLPIFNAVLNKSFVRTDTEDQVLSTAFGGEPEPELGGEPRIECPQAKVLWTLVGDYKDFGSIPNVESWEDCGRICALITTCNFWSWGNEENEDDKMFCTFYESAAELEFNPEYISGGRGCPETD